MSDERLPAEQILSYSLPAFGMAMILISVAIYLPNYYTDELGMTAGMLSWVFLIGRVWDAITDPLMGHLSDRTHSRWGRRRPYFPVLCQKSAEPERAQFQVLRRALDPRFRPISSDLVGLNSD